MTVCEKNNFRVIKQDLQMKLKFEKRQGFRKKNKPHFE